MPHPVVSTHNRRWPCQEGVVRPHNGGFLVQVVNRNGKEYVAASDRDFELYIFESTGP